MANPKIHIKDMVIIKEFMEPFLWDNSHYLGANLGKAQDLFKECFSGV